MSRHSLTVAFCALLFTLPLAPARASNVGTANGRIIDATTKAPLAGVRVTLTSPSQSAVTVTDNAGAFSFLSLSPDTYTIGANKPGFYDASQAGITIFADQAAHVDLALVSSIKTITTVIARSNSSLVRAGTTSDVYSVNPAAQQASATLAGSGSLNQAYGAIASAPGVNVPSDQQGWYQGVYVRGGDVDQVAYELDGLPMTRQSDIAPIATLTTLGSQEVQIYTGGTPASSNSSGLAGYINQVIKTGTYPGYVRSTLGVGAPAFYHSATLELSGATPDRRFSYYVGLGGNNQDYRHESQFNGAGNPQYFYPLSVPSLNSTYHILDGSCGDATFATPCNAANNWGFLAAPGASYGQATNFDRENVVNIHLALPHRNSYLRDDIQALYVTGGINTQFYGSANELGARNVGQQPFLASTFYNGALMQAPDPSRLVAGPFPSSASGAAGIPLNQRDGSFNGYSIEKLQYQKNLSNNAYLRLLGYGEYSTWFINAPLSAQLTFGAELADYEVIDHTYGGGVTYVNQLSPKHLLTMQATYMTQKLQTYNAQFSSTDPQTTSLPPTGLGSILSNYVDVAGNCYNYTTGAAWSCFDAASQGGSIGGAINLTPGNAPGGTPAALAGATWLMTEDGHSAQIDRVRPYFTSFSITDLWQPNDRLTFNIGARLDRFSYRTEDVLNGYPARPFWFSAYNREFCSVSGVMQWNFNPTTGAFGAPCATPAALTATGTGGFTTTNAFQPRIAGTWTLNRDTVLRASYGRYARAEASSYFQYDTVQQNLASFISQFSSYGYATPNHDIHPDTADNFDLSLEKHLSGTSVSLRITPFFRTTRNQLQYLSISALGGTLAGLNIGTQKSSGVEFAVQKGDFARDGFSYELSYTHTNDTIRFKPINGHTVLDNLNAQIEQYNSYTYQCAQNELAPICGGGIYAANGASAFTNAAGGGTATVPNPYYCPTPGAACPYHAQPLLDPNGSYPPYDVIPSPFNAGNSYATPNVLTAIVQYRRGKLAVTPTFHWSDGASYGNPLVWPGYVPQACTQIPSTTPSTPGVSCGSGGALFLPDPYNGNRFDNLGSYKQPSQLTMNLQLSYDLTPAVSVTLSAVNVIDKCFQRGYAWDNPTTCVYSTLPSNILAPVGNFFGTTPGGLPAGGPTQLAYPYGTFFNITEVGTTSVIQPFGFFVNFNIKL